MADFNLKSIEAEQSVLGAILISGSVLDVVSDTLAAEDFFSSAHRAIYRAAVGETDALDVVSLSEALHKAGELENIGGLGYLTELQMNCPGTANVGVYTRIVKDYAKKRGLMAMLNDLSMSIVNESDVGADDLIAAAASRIGGMQIADGEGLRDTKQILKSLVDHWDKKSNSGSVIDGFETGLADLDRRFLGWKPGDLVVMAGRPSMGKSLLAFQIAMRGAVDRGCRVLGFSLEMTAERILERATANIGNIPLGALRKCEREMFGEYSAQINVAARKLHDADLLIDETPGLHINQIQARARSAHRRKPLDLVLVDHINIARGGTKKDEQVAQLTDISMGLKHLAKELGCPVLAVTQLNRGVEQRPDKRPRMSDLRGSGSIEQDADIVMLMYRDDYYHESSPYQGIVEINTAKFREGETGIDRVVNQFGYARVADLSPECYQQMAEQAPAASPARGFN